MAHYKISEIYDTTVAFITDAKTKIEAISFNDGDICYKLTKNGAVPYTLTISAHPTLGAKAKGRISIKYGDTIIAQAATKHPIAGALNKRNSDASRFITRMQSPRFFKLLKLADRRITNKIKTSDNSIQIFNSVYRFKETQR